MMKNFIFSLLALVGILSCAYAKNFDNQTNTKKEQQTSVTFSMEGKKILTAYFSRADENYSVGKIAEGNTEIVAKMIHGKVGGDLFHIETAVAYPTDYNKCIEVARKEKQDNARPAIKGDVAVEDYDIIFIGMPNWWGDVPMALYTFIEKHDWHGKTIIPFATHEGSGMGGMDKRIVNVAKGSTLLAGFAVYGHEAQNEREATKRKVEKWIDGLK